MTARESLGKLSNSDEIEVFPGDAPPTPTIQDPIEDRTFRAGEPLTVIDSATDAEDDIDGDAATASKLEWKISQHHDVNDIHDYELGPVARWRSRYPHPRA